MSEQFVENFKMLTNMTSITILFVLLSAMIYIWTDGKKLSKQAIFNIGVIFGLCSVLSTHFGVNYEKMMLNVRDLGPLIAGLYFDPVSGIIAGLIGGIERFIAGHYFNVGAYTKIACSVSTCLAGFLAAFLNKRIFNGKYPYARYAFFVGATMEVFHMYAVMLTHRNDIVQAFYVVDTCAKIMIIYTAFGMAATSLIIELYRGKIFNKDKRKEKETLDISTRFQTGLLAVMLLLAIATNTLTDRVETQTAYENASNSLSDNVAAIKRQYEAGYSMHGSVYVANSGGYTIQNTEGKILFGNNAGERYTKEDMDFLRSNIGYDYFVSNHFGSDVIGKCVLLNDWNMLFVAMPLSEVLMSKNIMSYELGFSSILTFSIIFLLITLMLNSVVVKDIKSINNSLDKITDGNLDEKVNVNSTSEFVSLSKGINKTVGALKEHIEEEKKRMEQELEFATNIQQSSLPKTFVFPNRNEFELYANMRAAKEVGGDFYDFFFIDKDKFVLVIADVSGKNISGALFMMRAKTAIRSLVVPGEDLASILSKVNNSLCEGNENEMFVTAWVAIVDLKTGIAKCANYGHEYPIVMRSGMQYEVYEDAHSLPLAAFEGTKAKVYDFVFKPGDSIFVYTDGIPEAINKEEEQYGMERLLKVLNDNKNDDLETLLINIRSNIKEFANGAEQFDDITMLGFKFNDYYNE